MSNLEALDFIIKNVKGSTKEMHRKVNAAFTAVENNDTFTLKMLVAECRNGETITIEDATNLIFNL